MITKLSEENMTLNVAELLVAYLEQIGVEYVFGIPGGAIEPLYNALARSSRRGGIRPVIARHETGAAFMADGYARETGKIGVCCGTSGPGATNLITGVACANENQVPMLVITGQSALPMFGRDALQESSCTGTDIVGMFNYCTHYSTLVSHPQQMETKLINALQYATGVPNGPAHLSIPVDIFRSSTGLTTPSYNLQSLLAAESLINEDAVETLYQKLLNTSNVVFLIGNRCSGAIGSILRLAELKNAPVITTANAKGLVNPNHPLFQGVFGFSGHRSTENLLKDASIEAIVAIGIDVNEWNSGGWNTALLNNRLIHIDDSKKGFAYTPMASLHVQGHIPSIFNILIKKIYGANSLFFEEKSLSDSALLTETDEKPKFYLTELDAYESNATPIKPQRLMRELGHRFPSNTRFFADTGNSVSWAIHYLHLSKDRRFSDRRTNTTQRNLSAGRRRTDGGWLRLTPNFASMGWAIGGAIGTALGNSEVPVVCITGDGSVLMSGQEISVAVAEKLTVIFVVLNDAAFGMVKHGQILAGAERGAFELPQTNFETLAHALGAKAYVIRSPEDFDSLDIDAICKHKGPTLLDVHIDRNEIPPIDIRVGVLAGGKSSLSSHSTK
ncbi:MAG: thiamine pyrophosphate-binding protein [Pseudomonadota bacterium]